MTIQEKARSLLLNAAISVVISANNGSEFIEHDKALSEFEGMTKLALGLGLLDQAAIDSVIKSANSVIKSAKEATRE